MTKFASGRLKKLVPYVPGEQPTGRAYTKLNTNESPFPPSETAQEAAKKAAARLNLYPDPTAGEITRRLAKTLNISPGQLLLTNGSDEILNFAFMAFCDENTGAAFPDITYGFYPVFAQLNGIEYTEIPLNEDFSIDISRYFGSGKTIFIANPNAPTGIALTTQEIEEILKHNPDNVVVIDEAYVDFGSESCIPLINKYDNLLVTQTFSKSRSMAGARLGFGAASTALISELNTIKYSTNPYNINQMTMAVGIGTLEDSEYTEKNCAEIIKNREFTAAELKKLGFYMTDSMANFVFAAHPDIDGGELYRRLKDAGVLVRHFDKERILQYNRITIGTKEQMLTLLEATAEILKRS